MKPEVSSLQQNPMRLAWRQGPYQLLQVSISPRLHSISKRRGLRQASSLHAARYEETLLGIKQVRQYNPAQSLPRFTRQPATEACQGSSILIT